jgi:hypothetical protein
MSHICRGPHLPLPPCPPPLTPAGRCLAWLGPRSTWGARSRCPQAASTCSARWSRCPPAGGGVRGWVSSSRSSSSMSLTGTSRPCSWQAYAATAAVVCNCSTSTSRPPADLVSCLPAAHLCHKLLIADLAVQQVVGAPAHCVQRSRPVAAGAAGSWQQQGQIKPVPVRHRASLLSTSCRQHLTTRRYKTGR